MPPDTDPGPLQDGAILLGLRLREMRTRRNELLEAVSAGTGLTPSYLSDLERGTKLPSLPALVSLAEHYGVLVTHLLRVYPFGRAQRPDPEDIRSPADGRRREY